MGDDSSSSISLQRYHIQTTRGFHWNEQCIRKRPISNSGMSHLTVQSPRGHERRSFALSGQHPYCDASEIFHQCDVLQRWTATCSPTEGQAIEHLVYKGKELHLVRSLPGVQCPPACTCGKLTSRPHHGARRAMGWSTAPEVTAHRHGCYWPPV